MLGSSASYRGRDVHVRLGGLRVALAVDRRRQDQLHVSVHGLHAHQAKDCGRREAHIADGLFVRGCGRARVRAVWVAAKQVIPLVGSGENGFSADGTESQQAL
jgi:hypothetical protein